MLFLLLAGILTIIALLFVLPPLWRQRHLATADDGPAQRNIAIAKQRLHELKAQLQAGQLSQQQYDEQRIELELALSDDLELDAPSAVHASGSRLAYVLVLAIPLLAATLYAGLGNFQALEPTAEMLAGNSSKPNLEDIKKMVGKLAERMKSEPNNAEGWLMLGKSYKYLQQYPQAVEAFAKAYQLLGEQVEIMLLYADALAFANNEQLTGKPAELVFKALAIEPENLSALWLGGMAKAQAGDSSEAIKLWRKLLTVLPPDSPAQQEIQGLLAEMGVKNTEATATDNTGPVVDESEFGINVHVELAPDLQAAAKPSDTVFVYAQALSGPKMPLAILRKQVVDLPLSVTLTDAMAMLPTMKLSAFPKVKLLARISPSGNAMPQAGDLMGSLDEVAIADKKANKIVINSTVK